MAFLVTTYIGMSQELVEHVYARINPTYVKLGYVFLNEFNPLVLNLVEFIYFIVNGFEDSSLLINKK